MVLGELGPLTTLMEGVAAAVGAGMLLGGFVTGVAGLVFASPRKELEARVLRDGYVGGGFGVGMIIADIMFRYSG